HRASQADAQAIAPAPSSPKIDRTTADDEHARSSALSKPPSVYPVAGRSAIVRRQVGTTPTAAGDASAPYVTPGHHYWQETYHETRSMGVCFDRAIARRPLPGR